MAGLGHDLRQAVRSLARRPAFSLAAVTTLAIGIGATTGIFGVVRTLLLRPLPGIAHPEALVELGRTERGEGFDTLSYLDFADLRQQAAAFDGVFAYALAPVNARVGGETSRVLSFLVSSNYFDVLGVAPATGSVFAAARDDAAETAPVAVVSDAFWRRRLGGDPAAIGAPIWINGHAFTLLGVTPRSFHGHQVGFVPEVYLQLGAADLARPGRGTGRLVARGSMWLMVGGRLRPGVSLARAQAEVETIMARIATAEPASHEQVSARLVPFAPVPAEMRAPLTVFSLLLLGLVALVMVVAATNTASLMLARAEARSREMAIRRALGAGRREVIRHVLVESLVIYLVAIPPALLLARWGVTMLAAVRIPAPFPIVLDFPIDGAAFAFSVALAVLSGVLFGLAPALHAARSDPQAALRDLSATGGARRLRLREALVVGQLALSVVLLAATALFARALGRAAAIDPGFETAGVVTAAADFALAGVSEAEGRVAQGALAARLAALPGVEAAAFAAVLPLNLSSRGYGGLVPEGAGARPEEISADANVVTPGFFAVLGVPVRGRDFAAFDSGDTPGVAVVDAALGRAMFGESDPLGRSFMLDPAGEPRRLTVVGVVPDGRYRRLGAPPRPTFFMAAAQTYSGDGYLLVRSGRPAADLAPAILAELRAVSPNFPRPQLVPLAAIAAMSTLPQRIAGAVAGACGAVALLLAGSGRFGARARAGPRGPRAGAPRPGGGAGRADVRALVLRSAGRSIGLGLALGLGATVAAAGLLKSWLFGLPPLDPIALGGTVLLLAAVAVAAALIPAAQATAIDPMRALRYE